MRKCACVCARLCVRACTPPRHAPPTSTHVNTTPRVCVLLCVRAPSSLRAFAVGAAGDLQALRRHRPLRARLHQRENAQALLPVRRKGAHGAGLLKSAVLQVPVLFPMWCVGTCSAVRACVSADSVCGCVLAVVCAWVRGCLGVCRRGGHKSSQCPNRPYLDSTCYRCGRAAGHSPYEWCVCEGGGRAWGVLHILVVVRFE
jgi:hypothetical protein